MTREITPITEENATSFRPFVDALSVSFGAFADATPRRVQAMLVVAVAFHNAGAINLSEDDPSQVATYVAREVREAAEARVDAYTPGSSRYDLAAA